MKVSSKFFTAVILAAGSIVFHWQTSRAETITEGFDNFAVGSVLTMPEGWDYSGIVNTFSKDVETYKAKKPSIAVSGTNNSDYLVTPMLQGEFSCWLRNYTKSYQAYIKAVECTYEGGNLVLGDEIGNQKLSKTSSGTPTWTKVTFTTAKPTRVALLMERCYFDDFTYTKAEVVEGPSLSIAGFASGSSYDFGGNPVPDGTEMTFVLNNIGGADLTIKSITITGDYKISEGGDITSIPVKGSSNLTVKTPAKNTEGILTIESNDENSPYTVILSSEYKVPMPIMNVNTTNIDFGKVTETMYKTITVSNTGDADLIASVTSSDDSFTVDPTSLNVQPGGSIDLTVTFNYNTEAFGEHTGVVKIIPKTGTPVDINVTAFAKDPTLWEEDFEGEKIPDYWNTTGWIVTKNFTGNNGTYMAYAGINSSTLTLTTPRLIAKKGEVLRFEVGGGIDGTDRLTVEYSHDLQSWSAMEGSPLTSTGEKIFTAPEDGYYYIKFNGKYGAVDNFFGFRLALKEHDLSLTGQNIPTTAHQYSPYTATVTVKEMLGKEETATVSLWVNSVKVAETENVQLQANEEKTVALTFMPTEPMKDIEAKMIVDYQDESFSSQPVTISILEALTLDENEDASIEGSTVPSLVLNYSAVNGWNTIAVPFVLTSEILEKIFGLGFEVYEFQAFADNALVFKESTKIVAGYPYLVKAVDVPTSEEGIILNDVRIEDMTPGTDTFNGISFGATFSPLKAEEMDSKYSINSDSLELIKTTENDFAPGYRGYVSLPTDTQRVPDVTVYTKDGVVTGVTIVGPDAGMPEAIYDMQGRKVRRPLAPGIYIINGNKVCISSFTK